MVSFYNSSMRAHGGNLESVYTLKNHLATSKLYGDYQAGVGTPDYERGRVSGITAEPWQTDTCLGDWFYKEGIEYKTAGQVVKYLVDVVSKNGTLMLNFPLRPDGTHDSRRKKVFWRISLTGRR